MKADTPPRSLTHDEKKAAEAAFTGRPFNPEWSDAARTVYDGILIAMTKSATAPNPSADHTEDLVVIG